MPATPAAPLPGVGEDEASHNRRVAQLKSECKKANPNKYTYQDLMKRTFSFRRQMLLEKPISVQELMSTYPAVKNPDEVHVAYKILFPHVTSIYTMYQLQLVREFDRINESPMNKTIMQTWEALVPIILELAANENSTSIDNMLDGVDHFSEGKYAHVNIFITFGYK